MTEDQPVADSVPGGAEQGGTGGEQVGRREEEGGAQGDQGGIESEHENDRDSEECGNRTADQKRKLKNTRRHERRKKMKKFKSMVVNESIN
jgi:hypothetical protein